MLSLEITDEDELRIHIDSYSLTDGKGNTIVPDIDSTFYISLSLLELLLHKAKEEMGIEQNGGEIK